MERFNLTANCVLIVQEGDLTRIDSDAIVNAANQGLLGGGGVDGAIHRAAGPDLKEACQRVPEVRPGVRCPTGDARLTPGFRLPARHVIHTVGPVYRSGEQSEPLLRAAHRSALELANSHRLRSVAFPAISCGIYGYPLGEAAPIAVETCREQAGDLVEIRFVLFGDEAYRAWLDAGRRIAD